MTLDEVQLEVENMVIEAHRTGDGAWLDQIRHRMHALYMTSGGTPPPPTVRPLVAMVICTVMGVMFGVVTGIAMVT